MPRKMRITIWTFCIILIILAISAILSILFLKTNIFQSKDKLFAKYLMQNFNAIEILEYEDNLEIKSKLENNKYESELTGKIKYIENISTSGENKNNKINNVGVEIKSKVEETNKYNYKDISIKNENEDLVKLEYLKQDEEYGIRLNGIQQFVIPENNKENQLFNQIGIKNIEEILENTDITSIFKFTKEEKQTLINTYIGIIQENTTKDKYFKQSNSLITINNQDVKANAYTLKLTIEEYNNLYIKILEQIATDEIILSKIDLLESKIQKLKNNEETLRETFIENINDKIEKIQSNNIGSEKVEITVYENNKKTVRTSIEKTTNKIVIDIYNNSIKLDNIKLGQNINEQYIKIEKQQNEEKSNILVEFQKIRDNEITNNIKIQNKQEIQNDEISKNTEIKITNEKYEATLNINNKISLVEEFEEQITLDNNVVKLSNLPEESSEMITKILSENIQEQLNNLFSVVSISEYTTMLKNIGIIKKNIVEIPNEIQVTDIERKRFNSQFEFFQTENLTTDNIKELLQIVENNLKDMKIVLKNGEIEELDINKMEKDSKEAAEYKKSISEVQLSIKQDSNNEQKQEDILKFLEYNNSNKYTVSLEYDEDGLVNTIKMKIQEK